jgi:hypothetical protein
MTSKIFVWVGFFLLFGSFATIERTTFDTIRRRLVVNYTLRKVGGRHPEEKNVKLRLVL